MDLVLCNILSILVQKYERVALPQLGAFYHDAKTGDIRFNKFDSWNDERLEYAYCAERNVPFTTAKEKVASFVKHLQHELQQNSSVIIPAIGTLIVNTTEDSIDLNITLVHEEVTAVEENQPPLKHKEPDFFALETENPVIANENPIYKTIPPMNNNYHFPVNSNKTKSKSIHRWIILGLFILIGVFIFLIYRIQQRVPEGAQLIGDQNDSLSLKENFDNYPIDVPKIDSNDLKIEDSNTAVTPATKPTKVENKIRVQKQERFYVIVGSRTSQTLAEDVENIWKKKGYQCKILSTDNAKFRISIGQHATKNAAEKQLAKIKTEVSDAWIFTAKE